MGTFLWRISVGVSKGTTQCSGPNRLMSCMLRCIPSNQTLTFADFEKVEEHLRNQLAWQEKRQLPWPLVVLCEPDPGLLWKSTFLKNTQTMPKIHTHIYIYILFIYIYITQKGQGIQKFVKKQNTKNKNKLQTKNKHNKKQKHQNSSFFQTNLSYIEFARKLIRLQRGEIPNHQLLGPINESTLVPARMMTLTLTSQVHYTTGMVNMGHFRKIQVSCSGVAKASLSCSPVELST